MRRHRTKMQLPQLITQLRRRRRQQQQQLGHLLLLLLLLSLPPPSLSAEGQQHPPLDSSEVVAATSGQEYLGQFTFFRSWVTKRRILIVRARDEEVERVLSEATYVYRCPLALRNVNLILLGDHSATETVFFHSEENRRDFVRTRRIDVKLRRSLGRHIRDIYRDLNRFRQWTLLLGYDGGRKRMYRRASFPAILRKIDGNAIRRREAKLQRQKHIYCPKLPGVPRR